MAGWAYYMGHLDTITVASGARVRAGDPIGMVSNMGTDTSPHVHFNVNRDADFCDDINPFGLLSAVENSSCGAAPESAGHPPLFCVDATRIANCSAGRYDVGHCAAFGTTCDMDTGAARCTPHLDGVFVGTTFPVVSGSRSRSVARSAGVSPTATRRAGRGTARHASAPRCRATARASTPRAAGSVPIDW